MKLKQETLQHQLDEFLAKSKPLTREGKCASYIPALSEANPSHLGIYMISEEGETIKSGETERSFTFQSISKVVSFIHVCSLLGIPQVLEYVDLEPTGDAYNSIFRLELNAPGKPFNPMINAGAITVASLIPGRNTDEKLESVLLLLEKLIGRKPVINEQVFQSEWETAHRNRSIAYWLKGAGFLVSEVEEAIEVYLKLCAIEVTVADLAMIGLILAKDGVHPLTGEVIFTRDIARIAKTLMLTCGMYDYSGKYAAFVGIPSKSGVSGGIMCSVSPDSRGGKMDRTKWGIGVYGPAIDSYGNSTAGVHLLRLISSEWDWSVF
jgi:glutaminase